jgi:hypothetical protein
MNREPEGSGYGEAAAEDWAVSLSDTEASPHNGRRHPHNFQPDTCIYHLLIGSLKLILVDGTKLLLRLPFYHIPIRERIAALRGQPSWPIISKKASTDASER